MAIVQGIREKVHLPIYDSLSVEAGKQLKEAEPSSILKFFVDVQKKTKLETTRSPLLATITTLSRRGRCYWDQRFAPEFPGRQERRCYGYVVEEPGWMGAPSPGRHSNCSITSSAHGAP